MHDRILRLLRNRFRARQFVVTIHADDELDDDGLTLFDVERCILGGHIVERQKDR